MEQRGDELPDEAWREITVAQGSQEPRTYRFSAQRVRATRRRKPGEELWAVWRRNLDGSEPRYYLSNAPEGTTLETLTYVGGSRWRIETEFETEKGDVGLDEYETRSWAGWHHHIAMCLLGGAFLLSLQQDWGEKDAPDHEATGVPGGAGDAAPGAVRPDQLLLWLEDTQLRNERARRSHERRRSTRRESRMEPPPLTRRCSTSWQRNNGMQNRWDVQQPSLSTRWAATLYLAPWAYYNLAQFLAKGVSS